MGRPYHYPRALVVLGVMFTLALGSVWLCSSASHLGNSLVHASYDASQAMLEKNLEDVPAVIIYLDLDSFLRERQNPSEPWDRALHARLVRRLTAAGARAVVFDIIFGEAGPSPSADAALADAFRANGHVVLATELGRSSRSTIFSEEVRSTELLMPTNLFLRAAAATGVAAASVDDDFVVRRQFNGLLSQGEPSLAAAAARVANGTLAAPSNTLWLRYYGKPLTIPNVSYSTALRTDEVADSFFRDKVVFIGARPVAGTFLERKDEFRSPLASWGDRELFMPAVEVHATHYLNLVRGDSLRRLPAAQELPVLFASAIFWGWLMFQFRPLPAAGVALLGEALVLACAAVLLGAGKLWFPWLIVNVVQIPVACTCSALYQSLEWYRQKRRMEAAQRAAGQKIREQAALIEKAQDAILVQDLSGRVIYLNPSAGHLYGWDLAELQGNATAAHAYVTDEKLFQEARKSALETGEWMGELEQLTREGRKITVASRFTLITDERGEPKSLLIISSDVTEKKRLEQDAYRAQRIESIGALAGGMAHDLNNALAPVLMGLQLLQKQNPDDETRRMLQLMEGNTHRGAEMVRQVLLFSRGRDAEKEILGLGSLLREMERIVQGTFPKNIKVGVLAPPDLWPVMGNATQLHQVILNLCVNARDAMPQGGELTLAADNAELGATEAGQLPQGRPGRFIMVVVSDTGGGIAPEIMPRIFEPFFTTKAPGAGTGLGLSTIHRIVHQHNGFVNVRSEVGRGTTFEIYLPKAAIAPAAVSTSVSASQPVHGDGELIMVVDDELSVREMVSLGLTAHGYRVIAAANGAEAVAMLEQEALAVRLVLLDTDMPLLGGEAAFPLLRKLLPQAPIVMMTGQLEVASEDKTPKLAKPFSLDALLQVVAERVTSGLP